MIGPILRLRTPKGAGPAAQAGARPAFDDTPLSAAELERFRALMLPHLDGVYSYVRFLCRDPALADDLTQEAYLRACRGFRGYRGGDAKTWLFAVARSCFLSWARTPGRAAAASDDGVAELPDEGETPEQAAVRRGEVEQLRAAIQTLPEPFRETLVLRELEELSYKQLAEATGAPIGTVMSRLARARQLLLSALGEENRP
jgi:RNA polymerase sigma-70 factor (ECF subfamily)